MGFTGAGLPLGVTFSFLISSPMVDLGSLVLLTSIFGVKIAAVYVLLGLFVAVLGGTVIEKLHMEAEVEEFIRMAGRVDLEGPALTVRDRLAYVQQKAWLFSGTIASNLRYSGPKATEEELMHAADVAQAGDFIRSLPDGLHSYVAQGGTNFSGGQSSGFPLPGPW